MSFHLELRNMSFSLHLNLTEHLNAEIYLGTVTSFEDARRWVESTFFYIRAQKNPSHYAIAAHLNVEDYIQNQIQQICEILESKEFLAVNETGRYRTTKYGAILARFYTKCGTVDRFKSAALAPNASRIV